MSQKMFSRDLSPTGSCEDKRLVLSGGRGTGRRNGRPVTGGSAASWRADAFRSTNGPPRNHHRPRKALHLHTIRYRCAKLHLAFCGESAQAEFRGVVELRDMRLGTFGSHEDVTDRKRSCAVRTSPKQQRALRSRTAEAWRRVAERSRWHVQATELRWHCAEMRCA
jgi:hypothetical protein